MSNDDLRIRKLEAIRGAEEAIEKTLILELTRIRDICEEREISLKDLKSREQILVDKLRSLNTERKVPALLKGEVSSAANVQAVLKIISRDIETCKNQIVQALVDLEKAKDRESQVENDLREAKTKQKQIEMIVENRQSIAKIISDANEEIAIEELLGSKKK